MDTSRSNNISDTSHRSESSHQSSVSHHHRQQQRRQRLFHNNNNIMMFHHLCKCSGTFVYMLYLITGLIAISSSQRSLRLLDQLYEFNFNYNNMGPNHNNDDHNNNHNNNLTDNNNEVGRMLEHSMSEIDDVEIGLSNTTDPSSFGNIQEQNNDKELAGTKNSDRQEESNTVLLSSDNASINGSTISEVGNNTTKASLDPHEIHTGVLSTKDPSFFRNIQDEIDAENNTLRCQRYDGYYNAEHPKNRRIFYGSLIANEPWELFEIVSAETYGIYTGMVFVEGNRTQNVVPRPFKRLSHGTKLAKLFGIDDVNQVQVRSYVDENYKLSGLTREHRQRAEILVGWKELGMRPDDVAILADSDETFTRDFLRAVQVCDGIPALDYEQHHCHHSNVKIMGRSQVFESSPECITKNRAWFHPDIIIGHCVEGISTNPIHQPAPRTPNTFLRARGFGKKDCGDWNEEEKITDNSYPLWNAADFRRTCGGRIFPLRAGKEPDRHFDRFTAYHFHNFFATFNNTRFKHLTYGHSNKQALTEPIEALSNDLKMMYRCVKDMEDDNNQKWKRVQGGFAKLNPWLPIYFQDDDYRQRRHEYVKEMVLVDDAYLASLQNENVDENSDNVESNTETT